MVVPVVALIDDLSDNTDILSMLLTELCGVAEVRTFNSGRDFLEQLQRACYGVILLDLLMPEMDGYEVFRGIRKIDPEVPVIALTAHMGERGRAMGQGFAEFVTKPVMDIGALCRLVRKYLDPPFSEKSA